MPAPVRDLLLDRHTGPGSAEPPSTELCCAAGPGRHAAAAGGVAVARLLRSCGRDRPRAAGRTCRRREAGRATRLRFQVAPGPLLHLRRSAARAEAENPAGCSARLGRPRPQARRAGQGPACPRCRAGVAAPGAQGAPAGGARHPLGGHRSREEDDGRRVPARTRAKGHVRRAHLRRNDGVERASCAATGFPPGEPFDPLRVDEGRRALYKPICSARSGRRGKRARRPRAGSRSPTTWQRLHRDRWRQLGYQTDTGPNADLFWEHRNLLGAGERLRVVTELWSDAPAPGDEVPPARLRLPQAEPARQRQCQEGEYRQPMRASPQGPGSASSTI